LGTAGGWSTFPKLGKGGDSSGAMARARLNQKGAATAFPVLSCTRSGPAGRQPKLRFKKPGAGGRGGGGRREIGLVPHFVDRVAAPTCQRRRLKRCDAISKNCAGAVAQPPKWADSAGISSQGSKERRHFRCRSSLRHLLRRQRKRPCSQSTRAEKKRAASRR